MASTARRGPEFGLPTVQLLHERPDGSLHVDWMIAQDPRGEAPLVTFRLAQRLDLVAAGNHLRAERVPDHRCEYLSYEGPVSGGRGHVRRLATGVVVEERRADGDWEMLVRWHEGSAQRLRIRRENGETWRIEVAASGGDEGPTVVPGARRG